MTTPTEIERAIRWGLCWRCLEKLGKYRSTVANCQEVVTLLAGTPQLHTGCARELAGEIPHVVAIWTSRSSSDPVMAGEDLRFSMPNPDAVEWRFEGRHAFREEVIMAVKAMLPALFENCNMQEDAFDALGRRVAALLPSLPRNSGPGVSSCTDCHKSTADATVMGCTKEGCPLFGEEAVA